MSIKSRENAPPPKLTWPQQSPIDLREPTYFVESLSGLLQFHYGDPVRGELKGDHEVYLSKGAYVVFDGHRCPLVKLHFHRPSEHQVNGKPSFMEVHLVHTIPPEAKLPSTTLVVGVFIDRTHEQGTAPDARCSRLSTLVTKVYRGDQIDGDIHLEDVLPSDTDALWHYEGSLTTDPWDEVVSWVVLRDHATLDESLTRELAKKTEKPAREVQALSRRFVLRSFK